MLRSRGQPGVMSRTDDMDERRRLQAEKGLLAAIVKLVRRRHRQQGPERHRHELERRCGDIVRLDRRGDDRPPHLDHRPPGARGRDERDSQTDRTRRARSSITRPAPPQGRRDRRDFAYRLADLRRRRSHRRRLQDRPRHRANGAAPKSGCSFLLRELDHRAKNVLAVAQAMLRLTRADTVADYVEASRGASGRWRACTADGREPLGRRGALARSSPPTSKVFSETGERMTRRRRCVLGLACSGAGDRDRPPRAFHQRRQIRRALDRQRHGDGPLGTRRRRRPPPLVERRGRPAGLRARAARLRHADHRAQRSRPARRQPPMSNWLAVGPAMRPSSLPSAHMSSSATAMRRSSAG